MYRLSMFGDASEFRPAQLTLARERRGLTKAELAERCGVSRRAVSDWEAGRVADPPTATLAEVLNFPEPFFRIELPERIVAEQASFRALTSLSARELKATLAAATVVGVFSQWIDRNFSTPGVDVPWLDQLAAPTGTDDVTPAQAAIALRRIWQLGSSPIGDMTALLESKGIRVFALGDEVREVDAFSLWMSSRPTIFLNVDKSAERLRFDLAHELAHLVLHRGLVTTGNRAAELAANEFAGNFLVPPEALMSHARRNMSLASVHTTKKVFGVSAMAMVVRLHQLSLINDWQYRSWMVELSKQGYRSHELDGISKERSSLLTQILRIARDGGQSLRGVATELNVPAQELQDAVLGLTLMSV